MEGHLGERIAFYVISTVILGGALMTVTRRNTVTAVMSLVATFFGLAAMFTLLSAQFLAAIQVLVYAGAIMTLFVFVVMVLNRDEQEPWALRGIITKAVGVGALGYLVVLGGSFLLGASLVLTKANAYHVDAPPAGWGSVADVGTALFTTFLFPFEAISLLLLVAVIGAVVVARTPKHATPSAVAKGAGPLLPPSLPGSTPPHGDHG